MLACQNVPKTEVNTHTHTQSFFLHYHHIGSNQTNGRKAKRSKRPQNVNCSVLKPTMRFNYLHTRGCRPAKAASGKDTPICTYRCGGIPCNQVLLQSKSIRLVLIEHDCAWKYIENTNIEHVTEWIWQRFVLALAFCFVKKHFSTWHDEARSWWIFNIPSRERSHIPPWEKETHLQKCLGRGYVSSQECNISSAETCLFKAKLKLFGLPGILFWLRRAMSLP